MEPREENRIFQAIVDAVGEDRMRELVLTPAQVTLDEGGGIPVGMRASSWFVTMLDELVQTPGCPYKNRSEALRSLATFGLSILGYMKIFPGGMLDEVLFREQQANKRLKAVQVLERAKHDRDGIEKLITDSLSYGVPDKATRGLIDYLLHLTELPEETRIDYYVVFRDSSSIARFIKNMSHNSRLIGLWETAMNELENAQSMKGIE